MKLRERSPPPAAQLTQGVSRVPPTSGGRLVGWAGLEGLRFRRRRGSSPAGWVGAFTTWLRLFFFFSAPFFFFQVDFI